MSHCHWAFWPLRFVAALLRPERKLFKPKQILVLGFCACAPAEMDPVGALGLGTSCCRLTSDYVLTDLTAAKVIRPHSAIVASGDDLMNCMSCTRPCQDRLRARRERRYLCITNKQRSNRIRGLFQNLDWPRAPASCIPHSDARIVSARYNHAVTLAGEHDAVDRARMPVESTVSD